MLNQEYKYTHRRSVRSICWNLCTDFINVNRFGAFSVILDKENSKILRGGHPADPLENAHAFDACAEAACAFGAHSARMVKMSWFLISKCWQVCIMTTRNANYRKKLFSDLKIFPQGFLLFISKSLSFWWTLMMNTRSGCFNCHWLGTTSQFLHEKCS